jgi:hypothetical protein
MSEIHEGGCVCGAVRFRTRGEPVRVSMCSCSWCKKRTGSAFGISVYFDQDNVEFPETNLQSYRLISDAGRWIESEFCMSCGTVVTWTLEFLPGKRGMAGGSFDHPTFWYTPERYVFTRSKPDWLDVPSGISTCAGMPGSPSD